VSIIPAAGLCSPVVLAYVLRLMADGRRLEQRLGEKLAARRALPSVEQERLIKDDYAGWMAPPF
jgi:hypothetical protein